MQSFPESTPFHLSPVQQSNPLQSTITPESTPFHADVLIGHRHASLPLEFNRFSRFSWNRNAWRTEPSKRLRDRLATSHFTPVHSFLFFCKVLSNLTRLLYSTLPLALSLFLTQPTPERGGGGEREEKICIFFLPSPSPLSFFRPRT